MCVTDRDVERRVMCSGVRRVTGVQRATTRSDLQNPSTFVMPAQAGTHAMPSNHHLKWSRIASPHAASGKASGTEVVELNPSPCVPGRSALARRAGVLTPRNGTLPCRLLFARTWQPLRSGVRYPQGKLAQIPANAVHKWWLSLFVCRVMADHTPQGRLGRVPICLFV